MTCRNCGKSNPQIWLQHGAFHKSCNTIPPFDTDKKGTKYKIAECGEDSDGWYVVLNNEQILFGLREDQAETITKIINKTINLKK